jgi:hypothetical protein
LLRKISLIGRVDRKFTKCASSGIIGHNAKPQRRAPLARPLEALVGRSRYAEKLLCLCHCHQKDGTTLTKQQARYSKRFASTDAETSKFHFEIGK